MDEFFGLRSVSRPIVLWLGNWILWGGGIPTPSSIPFIVLDSIWFLQVCTTENMTADIGDDIINGYVQLPFGIIPTLTMIIDIQTNGEG